MGPYLLSPINLGSPVLDFSSPSLISVLGFKLRINNNEIVGRTIPSYRLASDREKRKWKIFREQLDKSERKTFDEMMSYSRLYNASGVMACKPVLLHPILMSIIFEHYKQLQEIGGNVLLEDMNSLTNVEKKETK